MSAERAVDARPSPGRTSVGVAGVATKRERRMAEAERRER